MQKSSELKGNIYRSLRRLFAQLRKYGCDLDTYFQCTPIKETDSIYKYIRVLNPYLQLYRLPNGNYAIGNSNIHTMQDLLNAIINDGFNDSIATLYYSYSDTYNDSVYTLVYNDTINPQRSRFDSFVINKNGHKR